MPLATLVYYTSDVDPATHTPTVVWQIVIYTGTPTGLQDPLQGQTQIYTDPINIKSFSSILVGGNRIDVGSLPIEQQNILKLYSYAGDAAFLYKQP